MAEEKTKKAVIYCRVSDPKQVTDGHGLESQETRCREYAKHKGYDVVEVFHEKGMSGKLLERIQMQVMLKYLKKHNHQQEHIVIIDDISRLARDIETHIQLRTSISSAGAKLESPSIEFGEDSDSRLVEHLLASVAAHQREKNAETTKNRMRARVQNGYWVAPAPVGYCYEKVGAHGKMLVRDEPNASIVQQALEGFASGRFETQSEVKRFLELHASFPKGRNGQVHYQRVTDLLTRPIYAGRITLPNWGIHNHPAKHEALISFETYQRIAERLNTRAKAPTRKDISEDFPLRGFVTCGCCDQPMTSCWTKGRSKHYGYYLCSKKGCELYGKSIKKDVIEGEFAELLLKIRPSEALFALALDMFKELWDERAQQSQQRTLSTEKELQQIARKVDNLLDRIVDADSQTVIMAYEKRIQSLEDDKIVLEEKIGKCGSVLPDFDESFRTAFKLLENPHDIWVLGGIEDKRTALKLVFEEKLQYDRNEGFRTASTSLPIRVLEQMNDLTKSPECSVNKGVQGISPLEVSSNSEDTFDPALSGLSKMVRLIGLEPKM